MPKTSISANVVKKWTVDETAEWLVVAGLGDYTAGFISRGINGKQLLVISEYQVQSIFPKNKELQRKFWNKLENIAGYQFEGRTTSYQPNKSSMFGNRGGNSAWPNNRTFHNDRSTPVSATPHGHFTNRVNNPPLPQRPEVKSFANYEDDDDEWSDDSDDSLVYKNAQSKPIQKPTELFSRPALGLPGSQEMNVHHPPVPPRSQIHNASAGRSGYDDIYLPVDAPQSENEIGKGIPQQPSRAFNHIPTVISHQDNRAPIQPPLHHHPARQYQPTIQHEDPEMYEPVANIDHGYPARQPPRRPDTVLAKSPVPSPTSSFRDKSPVSSPFLSRNGSESSTGPCITRRQGSQGSQGSSGSSDHAETESCRKPSPSTPSHRVFPQITADLKNRFNHMRIDHSTAAASKTMPPVGLPKSDSSKASKPDSPAKTIEMPFTSFPGQLRNPAIVPRPDLSNTSPRKPFFQTQTNTDFANVLNQALSSTLPPFETRPPIPKPASVDQSPNHADRRRSSNASSHAAASNRGVDSQVWYRNITRAQAQDLITKNLRINPKEGCFIVRPGRGSDNPYSLTVYAHNQFYNLKIRCRTDNNYALGKEKENERSFPSVVDMIEYYMTYSLVLAENKGSVILTSPP